MGRSASEQAGPLAVAYPVLEALDVLDPATMRPVPRDGETLGEVMFRGNVVMKGYLKNKAATKKEFTGSWFIPAISASSSDGYIQLKDRSRTSSFPAARTFPHRGRGRALRASGGTVVAKPDEKWGETPCAFVELKPARAPPPRKSRSPGPENTSPPTQCPRTVVFAEDSENEHRQAAEIQAARGGEGGCHVKILTLRLSPFQTSLYAPTTFSPQPIYRSFRRRCALK